MTATLVIVNPSSAGGRTMRAWPELRQELRRAGVDFEHRLTGEPGEAIELTRRALRSGCERVVAVGGDGTLNEVVNGYFDPDSGEAVRPGASIGLLSSGTGGDFRRSVHLPLSPASGCALLARGDQRRIDVGRIDFAGEQPRPPRYFVNIADCGIGGDVANRVNASRKLLGGRATFLYHSLAALLTSRSHALRLTVDGETLERSAQNVVVANGRYFGGGMRVAPDALVDDGLFDIVILGDLSRRRSLTGIRRIYRGEHLGQPGVELRRSRRVGIEPLGPEPLLFDVEGEQIGAAPATLTCLPGALRFCAPHHAGQV